MTGIQYFARLIWEARRTYFAALLFLLLESLSNYALIFLQKVLIDDVFYAGNYQRIPSVAAVFAAVGTVHAIVFTMTNRYLVTGEFTVGGVLLGRMLRSLERTKVGAFALERYGKLVHIMTSDLFFGSSFVGWQMPRAFQEFFNSVLLIGILAWASPMLMLLVVVLCLLYLAVTWFFMSRLRKSNHEVSKWRSELLVLIEEGVAATREIIAYHRLKWEEERFDGAFNRFFREAVRHGKLENRQLRWTDPLKWGVGIAVLAYGGYELMQGTMSVGTFVVVFQFATLMSDSFFRFFQAMTMVAGNLAHHDRMQSVVDMEKDPEADERLTGPVSSIRFDRVTFRYEPDLPPVLRDFSAELPAGRKIAIIGKSGGGKSTIAQLLARFYEPEAGEILVNGRPLRDISREDWSSRTAVVFQDPYLLPDTIRTNILLGRPGLTEEDMIEACKIAQIHEFVCSLPDGYDTVIGERGIQLSGGQRQRIAIARAIIGDPEILVLDEATSALDLETERQLMRQLDARRQGKTTIMIAHRLSTIENADLILAVEDGRLAGSGTSLEQLAGVAAYQELLAAPREK
ncbi:MAG TPA: ABC transporter ATP-binding protein [Paenibacillaceae bacterium]